MRFRWPLFQWMFRPLRWLTLVGALISTCYVLFATEPLDFPRDKYAFLFVLIHSFLISRVLVRVRSESFAFLYSQGFSRDDLWAHAWFATGASVLAAWLPPVVLILSPLRGMVQDSFQNPWFPLLAALEWRFLAWSLLTYAILLPVFHYEWIRSALPCRGIVSGNMLAFAFVVIGLLLSERFWQFHDNLTRYGIIAGFALIAVVLAIFGRSAHRRIEVCS